MFFLDSLTGFLLGKYTSDSAFLNKAFLTEQQAVLYKTADAGGTWKPTVLGKGRFKDAFVLDDVIYAVKDSFTENSFYNIVSKIYASTDKGATWKEQDTVSTLVKAFATHTTQRTCKLKDTLYIISQNRDSLTAWNIRTNESKAVDLPLGYKPEGITSDNGKVWIIGYYQDHIALLERHESGSNNLISFKEIKRKEPLISGFHVVGSDISLIVGDEGSVLGVTHKYFKSTDKGHTWIQETIPSSLYVQPIAFLGKDKVWAYSGAASIQVRK